MCGLIKGGKGNYNYLCSRHGNRFGKRKTKENSVCVFLINVMAKFIGTLIKEFSFNYFNSHWICLCAIVLTDYLFSCSWKYCKIFLLGDVFSSTQ